MSAITSLTKASPGTLGALCVLCSLLLGLGSCGVRNASERQDGRHGQAEWPGGRNPSANEVAAHYCSADCANPVFARDVLQESSVQCGGESDLLLRDIESWYLRLEQRAWRVFHDESETHTNAERREFLATYVEHPVPVFRYGTVKLELVDDVLLSALSALVRSGSRSSEAYEHWLSRGASEGARSDRLVQCVGALRTLGVSTRDAKD